MSGQASGRLTHLSSTFLSIEPEDRMRAKSVIDCVGSRLGKSGASCLYQFLLIIFGATSGQISILGAVSVGMIGCVFFASKQLGSQVVVPKKVPLPTYKFFCKMVQVRLQFSEDLLNAEKKKIVSDFMISAP